MCVCRHSSGQSFVVLYMLHAIHIPRLVFITADAWGPSHYDRHTTSHRHTYVLLLYTHVYLHVYTPILRNILILNHLYPFKTQPWQMYSINNKLKTKKTFATLVKYT